MSDQLSGRDLYAEAMATSVPNLLDLRVFLPEDFRPGLLIHKARVHPQLKALEASHSWLAHIVAAQKLGLFDQDKPIDWSQQICGCSSAEPGATG